MDTLERSLFRLAAIVYNNSTGNMYTSKLIRDMALSHTRFRYASVWFIFPSLAIVLGVGIAILIAIGLWGKEEGNVSLRLVDWFCKTPIGKNVSDPYSLIITAAATSDISLLTYGITKLFSSKRSKKREEYIKNYIDNQKTK